MRELAAVARIRASARSIARRFVLSGAVAAGAVAAGAALPLEAQTAAELTGTVRGADGAPISGASVVMTMVGSRQSASTRTASSGGFGFDFVAPGAYEIRVEALGYRPLVALGLEVAVGDAPRVALTLTPDPPPVTEVDSVTLALPSGGVWRPGAAILGGEEIHRTPYRFDDLSAITAGSTAFDEALGVRGLPGAMTLVVVDGLPFHRAPHPGTWREATATPLFGGTHLAVVSPVHNPTDIELAGSAAGYAAIATRLPGGGGGMEAMYSGKPGWSSSELDLDAPSLLSYQGAASGTVTVIPERSQLLVSGEAFRQQTPLQPRTSEALATDLGALPAELLASLTAVGVETYERYSGLARYDARQGETGRLFFRGAAGYLKRGFEDGGGLGGAVGLTPAEESIDFSTAFGIVGERSRDVSLELRAGFSGSFRDFDGSFADGVHALVLDSGARLGDALGVVGESSRTDFVVMPSLRHTSGDAVLGLGLAARASNHTMTYSPAALGSFLFSDPSAVGAGRGLATVTSSPETSFGTQEYGLFVQYGSQLAEGVSLAAGARYDLERIGDAAVLNEEWLSTTGLANDEHPRVFHQVGLRGSLVWEPTVGGGTRVSVTGSLQEGDVDSRFVHEVLSSATDATVTSTLGVGAEWPTEVPPSLGGAALPTVTLFGPDTRAPRTTSLDLGLVQRVGTATTVFLGGAVRRTDFLTRRRNLNLPLVGQALDADGREVFGTPVQEGALVAALGDDARRFPAFGAVYALDPDGWSEYVGLTAGLEHTTATFGLYGSYTYSETTDNWIGAADPSRDASLPPGLPAAEGGAEWAEGVSDFDIPHRASGRMTVNLGSVTVSALYRYRSGRPFTPRYRLGVDANGDGSFANDVTFVPGDARVVPVLESSPCLEGQLGDFAVRNSCRGPARHTVNARVSVSLGDVAGGRLSLTVDALNLVETKDGVIDDALLLVDPNASIVSSPDGSTVTLPTVVNERFGDVLYPTSRGRMIRVGVRIGG